jgi:hypothetical protein
MFGTKHWREHAQRRTGLSPAIWSSFRFDPAWAMVPSELADCAYRDADFDAWMTQLETGA